MPRPISRRRRKLSFFISQPKIYLFGYLFGGGKIIFFLSPQPKLYLPGVCPADCLQISGPCDTIDHLFPYIPFPHSKTPSSGPHPLDLPPWGLTMPVGRQCTIQRSGAAQRTVSFGSSFFGGAYATLPKPAGRRRTAHNFEAILLFWPL